MAKKVGVQKSLMSVLGDGVVGGLGGGFGVMLGRGLLGLTAGSIVGSLGAATVLNMNPKYSDLATVVVVNGFMDAVASLGL